MKIRGYIDYCIYPRNGLDKSKPMQFAVLSIKLQKRIEGKSVVRVAGQVPLCQVSDYFEFEGEFDGQGSFQIKQAYRVDDDEQGAMSMLVFCFGTKTAEKMVNMAYNGSSMSAWNAFKEHPDSFFNTVTQVKGIGPRKVQKGILKYENHIAVDTLANRFQKYGLYLNKALSVYEAWGSKSLEKIESNPYSLIDLPNIPFETIDKIGLNYYGLSINDSRRIYGGVLACMRAIMQNKGHTFVWLKGRKGFRTLNLLDAASHLLKIDQSLVLEEVINLSKDKKLILDKKGFFDIVYLPEMYQAEKGIATCIRDSIAQNSVTDEYISQAITEYENNKGFQMADKQKEAVHIAVKNKFSIISGPPGSGKTTIIDCICGLLRKIYPGVNINLAAPTGKAAKRMTESTGMPASTVHRMLEYSPQNKAFTRNKNNPLDADVIIVDEFSMMSTMLTYQFLQAVPQRCIVIFVGDKQQLPSVDAGKVLEDLLDIHYIPKVILNKIYRQGNDSTILQRALDISNEKMPDLSPAKDFIFWEESNIDALQHQLLELYYQECKTYGIDNVLLLTPMNKYQLGVDTLNLIIQAELNPPKDTVPELKSGKRVFRLHDRVIQLKNEDDYGVFNGMVGTIVEIEKGDKDLGTRDSFTVDFGDVLCTYTRDRFENIKHAYALTIHKCQGSEATSVLMVCHSSQKIMMRKKLIYTGMTRAKKKLQMVGEKSMISYCLNIEEEPRNSKLKNFLAE